MSIINTQAQYKRSGAKNTNDAQRTGFQKTNKQKKIFQNKSNILPITLLNIVISIEFQRYIFCFNSSYGFMRKINGTLTCNL